MELSIEELKRIYKTKEKLVDSDKISASDDALAKLLFALGAGVLSIPNATGNIVKKLKDSSKKIKESMIVEEEEDGKGEN